MQEQINEFLKQLNREIKRTEERIEEWKKELTKGINKELYIIEEFGLARDAETITKLTTRRKALYEQLLTFKHIFNITD